MRVSIIIPTYNERGNIKKLLKEIFALGIAGLEVIIVDDSSNDGTIEVIKALRKRFAITLILRQSKLGLGSALKDGLSLAVLHGAQTVITMDADFSHDPAIVKQIIEEINNGNDLVIGSRRIPGGKIIGWGPVRTLMSRTAMELSRRVLGISARDVTSGFRAYRRRVLETIDLKGMSSTGYAFQEEILYKTQHAGFTIKEIPIIFHDRTHGKSKLGIRDIMEFFITVIRLRISEKY